MGKTHDPLSLRVHPSLLSLFEEEIAKGHDIQALPQELLEVDLVVLQPKFGVFKKVLWEMAKRNHKERAGHGKKIAKKS